MQVSAQILLMTCKKKTSQRRKINLRELRLLREDGTNATGICTAATAKKQHMKSHYTGRRTLHDEGMTQRVTPASNTQYDGKTASDEKTYYGHLSIWCYQFCTIS